MKLNIKVICKVLLLAVLLSTSYLSPAYAQTTCATNPNQQACSSGAVKYGVSETFFGSGGELEACSSGGSGFCAKQSAGELTVGNTKSNTYQAQAGFNTNREEYIEAAIVGSPSVDLGTLSSNSTNSGSAQFRVKSYLSHGYIVQIYGTAPTNAGHALTTSTTPGASTQGVEQFGMNLAVNTVPAIGALPFYTPNDLADPYSFGAVDGEYDDANQFKFESGDTIAAATKSGSYTTYTISYLANISPISPGGTYVGYNSIVATATF